MKRVVILGPSGGGKSVLARRLAAKTGLPVVHLDVLFWLPGWELAPREDAQRKLDALVAEDRWIAEGDFLGRGSADPRFGRADTVVFLDVPRRRCLYRVLRRRIVDRGRSRSDLPAGCREGIDLDLIRWIWRYPSEGGDRVRRVLDSLDANVRVHRLRSRADVERFLRSAPEA